MSSDEKAEPGNKDVEAHKFVTEAPAEDDPERKRKRKMSEDPESTVDAEGDEFGRRRK